MLGKFGLVRFEPFLAKLETEWFGFSQDLPKPNLNRLKPIRNCEKILLLSSFNLKKDSSKTVEN